MTKILIIEDDNDFSSILSECLADEADLCVVDVINNEQDAMNFVKSDRLDSIHCILLDLRLPRWHGDAEVSSMAGLRILQETRQTQRFYGTIIVLTSSRDAADGQRALAAGCDGYLCKNAPTEAIPSIIDELKVAIRGHVMLVSSEMRHVFFRDDISAKEARLLDLLKAGKSWGDIALELGYSTSKAAANIGDRIFDKLLSINDKQQLEENGMKKREVALQIWQQRHSPDPQRSR